MIELWLVGLEEAMTQLCDNCDEPENGPIVCWAIDPPYGDMGLCAPCLALYDQGASQWVVTRLRASYR